MDANFRNPMVAHEFGDQFGPYLEEVIRGRHTLGSGGAARRGSAIDFVATQTCQVPAEFLLGHEQFAKMIAELKRQYDIVLIDTPAIANSAPMPYVRRRLPTRRYWSCAVTSPGWRTS